MTQEPKHDNDVLDIEIADWKNFSEILRENDRLLFDQMMEECKQYKEAIATRGDLFTVECLLMTLILQQQKMIKGLMKQSDFPKSQTSIDEN